MRDILLPCLFLAAVCLAPLVALAVDMARSRYTPIQYVCWCLARLLTRFCADEACGKTIPCRIGTRRISEIGDRIATGLPRPTDLQLLADLSADVVASALCDHERLATLPYTTGMRYFRSELDEHILRSSCPAGVCRPIAVAAGAAS